MKLTFPKKEERTEIILRVPHELKRALKRMANTYGVSLNKLITMILDKARK